ncbi:hypothetical protein JHK82_031616 [Glycine max]|nr:hypothetical protein JHK85_032268 [Glycine max]KAG5124879.1 hypothetical protein JHK82_031616 [Glycine max]
MNIPGLTKQHAASHLQNEMQLPNNIESRGRVGASSLVPYVVVHPEKQWPNYNHLEQGTSFSYPKTKRDVQQSSSKLETKVVSNHGYMSRLPAWTSVVLASLVNDKVPSQLTSKRLARAYGSDKLPCFVTIILKELGFPNNLDDRL